MTTRTPMQSTLGAAVLVWLGAVACCPADGAGVAIRLEKLGEGQQAVWVANDYLKFRINPSRGGWIDRYLPAGETKDWVACRPDDGGLFKDQCYLQGNGPGELFFKPYAWEIIREDSEEAMIFLWSQFQQGSTAGIVLQKTYVLRRDSPLVEIRISLLNPTSRAAPVGYWAAHAALPGGEKNVGYYRPGIYGVDVATAQQKGTETQQTTGVTYVVPNGGWTAMVGLENRQGLVFLVDYNYLRNFYSCQPFYTLEFFYDRVNLPPGHSWSTRIFMTPCRGLANVIYASRRVVAGDAISRGDKGLDLALHLAAAAEETGPVKVSLRAEDANTHDLLGDEEIRAVKRLSREGEDLRFALPGEGRKNLVLKIRLTFPDGEESFERFFSASGTPNTSYRMGKPAKVKQSFRPATLATIPHSPPAALVGRGLYHERFKIEEGLAAGGWNVTPGYESVSLVDRTLTRFPQTYDELMRLDLIAGLDVRGDCFGDTAVMVKDFVEAGGSLLLTGGYYAYGDTFKESPLEPLLPVELGGSRFRW